MPKLTPRTCRIAVVDFFTKELPVAPLRSPDHKPGIVETKRDLLHAGFVVSDTFRFLPYRYFIIAKPEQRCSSQAIRSRNAIYRCSGEWVLKNLRQGV